MAGTSGNPTPQAKKSWFEREYRNDRNWVEHLKSNADAATQAMRDWQQAACSLRKPLDLSQSVVPGDWSTAKLDTFVGLSELLIVWAHRRLPNVDTSALMQFVRELAFRDVADFDVHKSDWTEQSWSSAVAVVDRLLVVWAAGEPADGGDATPEAEQDGGAQKLAWTDPLETTDTPADWKMGIRRNLIAPIQRTICQPQLPTEDIAPDRLRPGHLEEVTTLAIGCLEAISHVRGHADSSRGLDDDCWWIQSGLLATLNTGVRALRFLGAGLRDEIVRCYPGPSHITIADITRNNAHDIAAILALDLACKAWNAIPPGERIKPVTASTLLTFRRSPVRMTAEDEGNLPVFTIEHLPGVVQAIQSYPEFDADKIRGRIHWESQKALERRAGGSGDAGELADGGKATPQKAAASCPVDGSPSDTAPNRQVKEWPKDPSAELLTSYALLVDAFQLAKQVYLAFPKAFSFLNPERTGYKFDETQFQEAAPEILEASARIAELITTDYVNRILRGLPTFLHFDGEGNVWAGPAIGDLGETARQLDRAVKLDLEIEDGNTVEAFKDFETPYGQVDSILRTLRANYRFPLRTEIKTNSEAPLKLQAGPAAVFRRDPANGGDGTPQVATCDGDESNWHLIRDRFDWLKLAAEPPERIRDGIRALLAAPEQAKELQSTLEQLRRIVAANPPNAPLAGCEWLLAECERQGKPFGLFSPIEISRKLGSAQIATRGPFQSGFDLGFYDPEGNYAEENARLHEQFLTVIRQWLAVFPSYQTTSEPDTVRPAGSETDETGGGGDRGNRSGDDTFGGPGLERPRSKGGTLRDPEVKYLKRLQNELEALANQDQGRVSALLLRIPMTSSGETPDRSLREIWNKLRVKGMKGILAYLQQMQMPPEYSGFVLAHVQRKPGGDCVSILWFRDDSDVMDEQFGELLTECVRCVGPWARHFGITQEDVSANRSQAWIQLLFNLAFHGHLPIQTSGTFLQPTFVLGQEPPPSIATDACFFELEDIVRTSIYAIDFLTAVESKSLQGDETAPLPSDHKSDDGVIAITLAGSGKTTPQDAATEGGKAEPADELESNQDVYSSRLVGNKIDDPTSALTAKQIAMAIWGKEGAAARKKAREWMEKGKLPANLADGLKNHYVVSDSALKRLARIEGGALNS